MTRADLSPTAHIAHRPIHSMLVSVPITCFVGTLLTDIAYWRTAEMMWADFSAWLVTVGVILGILAAIALTAISASISTHASSRSAPDLAEKAIVPDYALSSHVAPLGLPAALPSPSHLPSLLPPPPAWPS